MASVKSFRFPTSVIMAAQPTFAYAREPVIARMPDGTLLSLSLTGGPKEPDDGNVVGVVRSEDNGYTWSAPEVLFAHSRRACWAPEMYVDGDAVCILVHTYSAESRYRELIAYQSFSYDSGKTWSQPRSLPSGLSNLVFRQRVVLRNGTWVFPVYWQACENAWDWVKTPVEDSLTVQWPKRSGVVISHDQGESFSLHGELKDTVLLWENNVVELSDGKLVMLMRAERAGVLYRSESIDSGKTWSKAMPSDIPNPNSKIILLRYGEKIILFHNPSTLQSKLDFSARKPLSMWVSHDDMATWKHKIVLTEEPMFYPHVVVDKKEKKFLVACENAETHYLVRVPFETIGV